MTFLTMSDSLVVTDVDATIFLDPTTVDLKLSRDGNKYEASLALIEQGEESIKLSVNLELMHEDYANLTNDDVVSLTAELKMHYMKIVSGSDL